MWFFETPPVFSLVFCQCKRSLPSRRYYSGFWSRGTQMCTFRPQITLRPATYCALRTVKGREKSRMRTSYKKTVWDSVFFAHALFLPKTRKVMGFSGSVNGTTNQGFWDSGFCQCKWAFSWLWYWNQSHSIPASYWASTWFNQFSYLQ